MVEVSTFIYKKHSLQLIQEYDRLQEIIEMLPSSTFVYSGQKIK